MSATMAERVYTIAEVARLLRVHEQTVRRMIKDGEIAAFKVRSEYRIRQSALDKVMQERDMSQDDE